MAEKTGIEWTDATWNPVRGCSRVSEGCRHCYAELQAARIIAMDRGRGIPPGEGSYDGLLAKGGQWNGTIRMVPKKISEPLRWTKPRMIFVNSMSDIFHENVPDAFILRVFDAMRQATYEGGAGCGRIRDAQREGHIFQLLTKRPDRMRSFMNRLRFNPELGAVLSDDDTLPFLGPLSRSIWLGVSVEDQATADERIPLLLRTPAAVRWVSAEPLLAPVELTTLIGLPREPYDQRLQPNPRPSLDWIVAGGESGPRARPMHPDWVRNLRDQSKAGQIQFLFKQWGDLLPHCQSTKPQQRNPVRFAVFQHDQHLYPYYNIGKRAAGRLLDGEQYDGYPEIPASPSSRELLTSKYQNDFPRVLEIGENDYANT